jgi:hypothetical protein
MYFCAFFYFILASAGRGRIGAQKQNSIANIPSEVQ